MDHIDKLTDWMINEGRRSGDPVKVVSHFCTSLIDAGVPLWRANIGQRFANPLLIAWGVVWTPEETEIYDVTHEVTQTDSYIGSSFEYLMEHKKPLHKSLRQLDPETDHISYLEFAGMGATDYYASLLSYGDGSVHGCTFVTRDENGFLPQHLEMIEAALLPLSCAMEPVTMRKSSKGLLRTYLGDGPSDAVWDGTIKRGERTSIEAVVMSCDLRGFTELSNTVSEERVFEALSGYFDLVVQSVEENGGDVLKFIGDGILSIFPISDWADRAGQCRNAVRAAHTAMAGLATLNADRAQAGQPPLNFGVGIDVGRVSYGNIGSPGRLDFTVLGRAVNVASRIEGLTKTLGHRILASEGVAETIPDLFAPCGPHRIRGLVDPINLFMPIEASDQSPSPLP
ncbi:MAG: adenylate/guanylate cyclase domain-containing protein [Pseudomonadota bacterium]